MRLDFEDAVHLYRDTERQDVYADRRARMPPDLTENLHHQIGGTVRHFRLIDERISGIDEDPEPDDPANA